MIDYKTCLNKQQEQAVTSTAQHLRIIAGAGTGKTRALTYRIAFLLSERIVLPSQLVAITFTNKVANEMKERVQSLTEQYNLPIDRMPLITTYHSFCLRFLRKEISYLPGFTKNFTIADDDDQKKYLKMTAEALKINVKADIFEHLKYALWNIKCLGLLPNEVSEKDIEDPILSYNSFINFYSKYQEILKKNNTMDFDDILIFAYYIIKNNPNVKQCYHNKYKAFLVDEYQDTNNLQYKLLREFLSPDALLTVVGDPDQTIYTWRGADAKLISHVLPKDFKDLVTVILNANYRSTQTILNTANILINNNTDRDKKNLLAASGLVGEDIDFKILQSQDLEAKYIVSQIKDSVYRRNRKYNEISIIYRSNYLSRALEMALAQARIPYKIYGGFRFYDRASIKDALAYLRVLINPEDNASTLRILQAPTRKIGPMSLANIVSFADQNQISYLEAIVNHIDELDISSVSKSQLQNYKNALATIFKNLTDTNFKVENIADIIKEYYKNSGFLNYINEIDKKKEEKEGKSADKELDNINELLANILSFFINPPEDSLDLDENLNVKELDAPTLLSMFLANIVLMSQQDEMDNKDAVNLMTVHVSKGLEFNEVFIAGLIQGVFPTSHAINSIDPEALQEERRMFYVALTRAKQKLHVTSYRGYSYISNTANQSSQFLEEAGLLKRNVFTPFSTNYTPQTTAKVPTYNNVSSIQKKINSLPEKKVTTGQIFLNSLANNSNTQAYNYKIGMQVISTSYGIGTVTEVNGNKVRAEFPDKADNKSVLFINTSRAFKPKDM